ncbi:Reverse transcriptase domain [Trinorchestia longiramus]|nr:Reverse transcriptase domain [Trinorchestia longiramus]
MSNKNAEECYMMLKDKIATATEHHIPRKRFRPTNNPPWFSQEIKRLINARQHSYRRLKRYQTEPHLNGPGGLGPRILKETAEVISEPLTNIFNRSLETGIVPDDWKRANITPIFKNGNRQIPYNYRPISLTSVISKAIERLLKVRITKHRNDQNLINDTQHGFREKRSCLTNLLDFFREVNRLYVRKKAIDLVYLDFQNAFDKVPHERLMAKVEAHGIRGNYSRWIRNWLTSRTQRVVIHDQASDSTLVTLEVPLGSVLGSLLFIIYINDLDVGIISKINKFADDTKLGDRAFTERDRVTIQSDLNRLLHLVLGSAYCGTLTSQLAVPFIHIPVDSLEQLLRSDMKFASEAGGALQEIIQSAESGVMKEVGERMTTVNSCYNSRFDIKAGKLAVFCDYISMRMITSEEFSENATCSFYVARERISGGTLSFMFPKKSLYKPYFDQQLRHMVAGGMIAKMIDRYTPNGSVCLVSPGLEPGRRQVFAYTITDLGGVFILLLAGAPANTPHRSICHYTSQVHPPLHLTGAPATTPHRCTCHCTSQVHLPLHLTGAPATAPQRFSISHLPPCT